MQDDERRYWATAHTNPTPTQPAYNSFMYPAPQPQPQPSSWTPRVPSYNDIPSISVESDIYAQAAMPQQQQWIPPTFSPPAQMPEMIAPNTPSSEGTHSPGLPEHWSLHTDWSLNYPTQSVHSSPASNVTDLHGAYGQQQLQMRHDSNPWENTSPFSPEGHSFAQQQNNVMIPRNRSFSDGQVATPYDDSSFQPGSVMPSNHVGVNRRHSSHVPNLSPTFILDRRSSTPYSAAHSARISPSMSCNGSPSSYLSDLHMDDSLSDGGISDGQMLAKTVVTTDPVSEAAAKRRTHEARFQCDICGKKLTTKTNLEGHRRSHLGVKEFKCGVCDKAFTRDWDRKRHEKTHSKKAELSCGVCGKTSSRKDAFDKHRE
jgi:hypothetical protein